MRFLIDESADVRPASPISAEPRPRRNCRGPDYWASIQDAQVLEIAHRERRILVTNDRDFGELVFSQHVPHAGVVYLRLGTSDLHQIELRLADVLERYPGSIGDFLVVTPGRIRMRPT